jgi:hypothetical protein
MGDGIPWPVVKDPAPLSLLSSMSISSIDMRSFSLSRCETSIDNLTLAFFQRREYCVVDNHDPYNPYGQPRMKQVNPFFSIPPLVDEHTATSDKRTARICEEFAQIF